MDNTANTAQQGWVSIIPSPHDNHPLTLATMPPGAKVATIGVGAATVITMLGLAAHKLISNARNKTVIDKVASAIGSAINQSEFGDAIALARRNDGDQKEILETARGLITKLARGIIPAKLTKVTLITDEQLLACYDTKELPFIYRKSLWHVAKTHKNFPATDKQTDAAVDSVISNILRLADKPRKNTLK